MKIFYPVTDPITVDLPDHFRGKNIIPAVSIWKGNYEHSVTIIPESEFNGNKIWVEKFNIKIYLGDFI